LLYLKIANPEEVDSLQREETLHPLRRTPPVNLMDK
jgi:hypothetical protein